MPSGYGHWTGSNDGGGGWGIGLLIAAGAITVAWALSTKTAARIGNDFLDALYWTAGILGALVVTAVTVWVVRRRRRGRVVHALPAYAPVRLVRSRRVAELERPRQAIDGVAVRKDREHEAKEHA